MEEPDRRVEGRQRVSGAQVGGYSVLERAGVESLEHLGTQGPLANARGRGIDRRQRLGQRLTRLDEAIARMRHFRSKQAAAHLAEGAHVPVLLYGLLELRKLGVAKVKEAQHQPLGIHDQLAIAPENDGRELHARLPQPGTAW